MPSYQKGTAMPNAVVMTGYGPPEVLKWAGVPLTEPGEGQIRIKVKAAGISPTDLDLRAGYLKDIPLPPNAVLGFEAAGTVDAVGPGVTGTSIGDDVTALLFSLGGYAEYAVASIWTRKPDTVSWIDAAALPSSAEAAAGVLRQLNVTSGETLLLFGGGGSVGIIATQLAVARGITVISAVGEHDETLARELGATPVRYGAGLAGRVRALGAVDAVFDAAGKGVLADAIALAGGPERVITLSDPAAADFGVTLSEPTPDRAPVPWIRRSPCWPTAGSPARAPIHAHAAGRRGPPPAGKRHRPRAHHPHPRLARAAQRRPGQPLVTCRPDLHGGPACGFAAATYSVGLSAQDLCPPATRIPQAAKMPVRVRSAGYQLLLGVMER